MHTIARNSQLFINQNKKIINYLLIRLTCYYKNIIKISNSFIQSSMQDKQYPPKEQQEQKQADQRILLKTQQSNKIQIDSPTIRVPPQLKKIPSKPIILFASQQYTEPSILLIPQQFCNVPVQHRHLEPQQSNQIISDPKLLLVPEQPNKVQLEPLAPQQQQSSKGLPANFNKLITTTKLHFLYGNCLKYYEGAEAGIKTNGFPISKQGQEDIDNLISIPAIYLSTHLPKILSKAIYKWHKQNGCILEVTVREEAKIIIINDYLSKAQIQKINGGAYHVDAFYIDRILIQNSEGEKKPFNCDALIVLNRQIIECTTLLTSAKASLELRRKNQILQKIGSQVKARIAKTQSYLGSI